MKLGPPNRIPRTQIVALTRTVRVFYFDYYNINRCGKVPIVKSVMKPINSIIYSGTSLTLIDYPEL